MMFSSAISTEILQIWKTITKFEDFIKSSKTLLGRITKQQGLINHMKRALLKLYNSQKECFIKFRKTNYYILNKPIIS